MGCWGFGGSPHNADLLLCHKRERCRLLKIIFCTGLLKKRIYREKGQCAAKKMNIKIMHVGQFQRLPSEFWVYVSPHEIYNKSCTKVSSLEMEVGQHLLCLVASGLGLTTLFKCTNSILFCSSFDVLTCQIKVSSFYLIG